MLGTVNHVDARQKVVSWAGPEGAVGQLPYDRLLLTAGSVNKLLPIPGVADYAHGFRSIAEAMYLRDHIIRQLELAAVATDLTRPGQVCGMTAQHAQRQGRQAARNIAASLGTGQAKRYKHHDEGFLVDLGGLAAAANPLHVPLSGPAANAVTRGYHLSAMSGNRMRVLADWTLNAVTPAEPASLAVISAESVSLDVDQPRA